MRALARRRGIARWAFAALLTGSAAGALAVESCQLNGEHVNPNNGNTTAGKTGLMRCFDGPGGALLREQELQQGRFMGVVRRFRDGVLEREHRVNEKGNRDGLSREWAVTAGGPPVLVREETLSNGSTVGLARSWTPAGKLRRVSFHGDDGRSETASVEFTDDGRLAELRCGPRPVLAPAFDDAAACGHGGAAAVNTLYSGRGTARARWSFLRGERVKSESLWDNGSVREVAETTGNGQGTERSFAADGTLRREQAWQRLPGERGGRVTVLDREFHESGKPVRERRWKLAERGGELLSDQRWYLNGQPKERIDYAAEGDVVLRSETTFHDNGRKASEGRWRIEKRNRFGGTDELATGLHRSFDDEGRLRAERSYDARGKIVRERELDERGAVVRDDEVYEDGSRKAVGR